MPPPPPPKSNTGMIVLLIVGFIVLVGAAVAVWYFFLRPTEEQTSPSPASARVSVPPSPAPVPGPPSPLTPCPDGQTRYGLGTCENIIRLSSIKFEYAGSTLSVKTSSWPGSSTLKKLFVQFYTDSTKTVPYKTLIEIPTIIDGGGSVTTSIEPGTYFYKLKINDISEPLIEPPSGLGSALPLISQKKLGDFDLVQTFTGVRVIPKSGWYMNQTDAIDIIIHPDKAKISTTYGILTNTVEVQFKGEAGNTYDVEIAHTRPDNSILRVKRGLTIINPDGITLGTFTATKTSTGFIINLDQGWSGIQAQDTMYITIQWGSNPDIGVTPNSVKYNELDGLNVVVGESARNDTYTILIKHSTSSAKNFAAYVIHKEGTGPAPAPVGFTPPAPAPAPGPM